RSSATGSRWTSPSGSGSRIDPGRGLGSSRAARRRGCWLPGGLMRQGEDQGYRESFGVGLEDGAARGGLRPRLQVDEGGDAVVGRGRDPRVVLAVGALRGGVAPQDGDDAVE